MPAIRVFSRSPRRVRQNSPRPRRLWIGLVSALTLSWLSACETQRQSQRGSRQQLRVQATQLIKRALESEDSAQEAELKSQAAALLERLWRQSGDRQAVERAIELLKGISFGQLGCVSQLRAATLGAELSEDLGAAIERVKTLREIPGCQGYAQRVLATLVVSHSQPQPEEREAPATKLPAPKQTGPVKLLRVERYGSNDAARIVVFLSGPAQYDVSVLPPMPNRGPRLFVDLRQTSYEGNNRFEVGGIVERVRLGEHDEGTRVVLDLRERVFKRVFYLPEPFRLVLDVSRERSTRKKTDRQLTRVVLDPGHGGYDPGAIGRHGLQEKDVALDVAHRAAPLIARELGISALLTRDSDVFVPLDERVAKANAFGADLFVSIHCNASESADSHGVMTFILDASGDTLGTQVAARENDASVEAGQQLATAMRHFMDQEVVQLSGRFAGLLQRASLAALAPGFPRVLDGGVRRAGFYVLAGAQMPAVLFETSFISNPTEEQRLDNARYRQKLADGVVNAIRAYREAP